jgi:high-affinity iron transporter
VAALREKLSTITADPKDLPLRAHEILEDSLRDRLTGQSDQGAGSGYPETLADLAGTRVVLDQLAPLITARRPDLLAAVTPKLDALEAALKATQHGDAWDSPLTAPLAERQRVQAAIGDAVEALSPIPDLLEIRQN